MEKEEDRGIDRRTFLKVGGAIGLAAAVQGPGAARAQGTKASAGAPSEKIDAYCHMLPAKYKEAVLQRTPKASYYYEADIQRPALWDLGIRFKAMDNIEGLRQVISPGQPPLEYVASPKEAVDLARIYNDEVAEIVGKYPDRFPAAVACLPMNDVDASCREAERAVKDLKFKGVLISTSINGKPLNNQEFLPLYELMDSYDLPIWIHPAKDRQIPDYPGEAMSQYALFLVFSWPYETTIAMGRLVYSGVLERFPNLKLITHHCGGMLPSYYGRTALVPPDTKTGDVRQLAKQPVEYFRRFYADTVMGGNTSALTTGRDFFGTSHVLFASDYPYPGGATGAEAAVKGVVKSVESMGITDEEKGLIFSKNTRTLLKLT